MEEEHQPAQSDASASALLPVAMMVKVARAIHHAHVSGILHRDLKPANVLIDAAGEPQITDFGLARKMGAESGLTMTGQVMGTPHYMSPEQARGGNRELTPTTDDGQHSHPGEEKSIRFHVCEYSQRHETRQPASHARFYEYDFLQWRQRAPWRRRPD